MIQRDRQPFLCPQDLLAVASKQEPDTSSSKHNFRLSKQRGCLESHKGPRTEQTENIRSLHYIPDLDII